MPNLIQAAHTQVSCLLLSHGEARGPAFFSNTERGFYLSLTLAALEKGKRPLWGLGAGFIGDKECVTKSPYKEISSQHRCQALCVGKEMGPRGPGVCFPQLIN